MSVPTTRERGASPTRQVRGVCIRQRHTSPHRVPQVMHHNALLTRDIAALVLSRRPKAIQRPELCLSFRRQRIRDCAYGMMCLDQLSRREGQGVVYNSERRAACTEERACYCVRGVVSLEASSLRHVTMSRLHFSGR